MSETATVTFSVMGLERVTGHGGLVAFAAVEMEVEGVVLLLDGVAIVRAQAGGLVAQAPRFRGATGEWRPALGLPVPLTRSMGEAVLQAFSEADTGTGHWP